jgi:putative ABC transport system permease protein
MPLGHRVFRALLRLLPGDFRSEFSDAMHADAGAMQANAASTGGRTAPMHGSAYWWTHEIPGLVAAIVRERSEGVRSDIAYSIKHLARTPGFTLIAVLMLALGTGANAAVFSVIDAAIIRPAFADPERVVLIQRERPDGSLLYDLPAADVAALADSRALSAVTGIDGRYTVLTNGRDNRRLRVECVSASAFDVVGVQPAIGRAFTADEDRALQPVIVLSYTLWQREFSGRTNAIGSTITLDGKTLTVVGVMPRGYLGVWAQSDTEAFAPLGPVLSPSAAGTCPGQHDGIVRTNLQAYARIRPPFTAASAAADLNAAHVTASTLRLQPSYLESYDSYRGPLIALAGMVGCVLLIACATVANLQLERLSGRRRELLVRLALGATHARIVRQTLTENLLLSMAGAAAGIPAATLTLRAIRSMMPPTMPNVDDVVVNASVLTITMGLTITAGILVGLVPALHSLRSRAADLRGPSRGLTGGGQLVRRALVVAEVALSVALLIGAGLMIRTFLALRPAEIGFETTHRMTARTLLNDGWRATPAHRQFMDDVLTRLSAIAGVDSASGSSYLPLSGYTAQSDISARGPAEQVWSAWTTPSFFRDLDIGIVRGRDFTAADGPGAPPVAVVNETFARHFFPDDDALGRTIDVHPRNGPAETTTRTIVGIVRDIRDSGRDVVQRPKFFAPYAQEPGPALLYFVVKTHGAPQAALADAIKAAVRDVRPGQTVERLETLQSTVDRAFARPRFGAWLFGVLAAIAAILSALGLGAVVLWWVAERRREIGVRMALGASRNNVAALVVRQALVLTLAGAVLGTAAAAAATRLLAEWLYGVTPTDPATFAGCTVAMLAIAAAAAYLPARRAGRIDPAITLRTE